MYVFFIYSGTPIIRPPKNIGRINEGFLYKKMYGGFCQAAKTKWRGRKAGFRCTCLLHSYLGVITKFEVKSRSLISAFFSKMSIFYKN